MNSAPSGSLHSESIAADAGGASRFLSRLASSLTQFALRIALAVPFFMSGLTKWDGFLKLSDSAVYLFSEEFRLHVLGNEYAYPHPETWAFSTAVGEIIFPALLVIGLGSRLAAFGILVMTAIIQVTFPDGWQIHLSWAAMALAIMSYGPGFFSLDRLIAFTFRRSSRRGSGPLEPAGRN